MQKIKDRIAEALKLKGKTPKELSDLTGIPISFISQYMSGHVKPKHYFFVRKHLRFILRIIKNRKKFKLFLVNLYTIVLSYT